ncbi:DUF2147 domain-containing protein [Salinisphaera orenii]|uniref:DUF2147 domain-containing protein n=1 Tax=Salinisphaera orenii TaxID=856731 RepID=UPI000DBE2B9B
MTIRLLTAALFVAASPLALASGLGPDAITGVWQTESKGYVQIYKRDSDYVGRAVGDAEGKPRYDKNNPDKSKRGRPLLGVRLIRHLKHDSGSNYHDGEVYDPDNGKTYSLAGELVNRDTLHLRGYVGISLFGKTQTWHRIDPHRANVHEKQLHEPLAPGPGNE